MATPDLCWTHYQRKRRYGRFDNLPQPDFWSKVARTGSCWPWMGAIGGAGYGRLRRAGRYIYAHRLAYELSKGPIPADMVVDHRCFNTLCCNPDHLRLLSLRENSSAKNKIRHGTRGRCEHRPTLEKNDVCAICLAERQRRWRSEARRQQQGLRSVLVSCVT